ncbi:hypothetical protein L2E82_14638 [Cichorium intybus]|uniref:Uncharacterized protein n=1 Tax=Cichorium intybus TaxID=13427 RepID=A0ACB9F0J1_CICIN|nr:hypothetical protein L2E82_14638 [Cichorium intybus]
MMKKDGRRLEAFPDALFYLLILAMSHPDHETRVLAHRVFSNVLMPAVSQPSSGQKVNRSEIIDEGTGAKENNAMELLSHGGISHSLPNGKTV